MAGDRIPDARMSAIESAVEAALMDARRFTLAFSGGLASTLLAAVARKRGDPRCIAVGVEGSEDLRAAELAARFLDYRVEIVSLAPKEVLTIARELVARFPTLSAAEVLGMVPLAVVQERTGVGLSLAGFADWTTPPDVRAACERMGLRLPLLFETAQRHLHGRADLEECADRVGLPARFARVSRRTPAAGSGVSASLHAFASKEGRRIEELLGRFRSQ